MSCIPNLIFLQKWERNFNSKALHFLLHIILMRTNVISGKMLGQILVTKQTGPQGKVVSKVWN